MEDLNQAHICEMIVQQLWSDVLTLDSLDSESDFFELGGHSLTALTITSRLESLLEVEIPLRLIFDKPLLSEYADALMNIIQEKIQK